MSRQTIEDILEPAPTVEDILGPVEHDSNVAADAAKRFARETGAAGGQAVSGLGRLGEIVQRAMQPGGLPPAVQRALLDTVAPGTGKMLREGGEFVTSAAREAYDTDPTRDDTLVAKLAQGAGSLPAAIASGPAAPITVAAMMGEQGAEDARASLARRGITDPAEIQSAEDAAFLVNAPVGAASEALLGVPKLLKGVRLMQGATAAGRIGRQVAVGAAREGAQEGIEQLAQNIAARDIVGYDPERSRTEGVGESVLLGALLGGPTGGAFAGAQEIDARAAHAEFRKQLDTAQNIPESTKTLLLQQDQLRRGLRPAQMFPKGSPELPLPEGAKRAETERGVFHYNPEQITAERLAKLSAEGRENEILGLGPVSKPDAEARAAATGEPVVAVTERAPDGTEIKTAVGTTGTAAAQVAALEATKSPGSVVAVESPRQTITERLRAQQMEEEAKAKAALAREQLEREQRQQELADKRLRFEETLGAADALAADPQADFSKLKAALTSLDAAIEDNSLGLTLDQRQAALARVSAIRPRAEAARAAFEAEQEARVAAAKAAEQTKQAEAKAARRAEREAIDAIEATGRDPREGNTIVDITKVPDAEFEQLRDNLDAEGLDLPTWEKEMERRIRVQEADTGSGVPRFSLLDLFTGANGAKDWASSRLTLPTPEALRAAGDPLAGDMEAIRESLPFSYFRKDSKADLDGFAARLRELGFRDATTPAAALDMIRRAAGGEDIRPTASADFAAAATATPAAPRILTEAEVAAQFAKLRSALGPIARQFDIQTGLVADLLDAEGYGREAAALRAGRLGDIQAATAPRLRDRITAHRAQRRFIVIGADAARKGRAPGLLLHELAHPFFDGLPGETRAVLRRMHGEETRAKSGPLYADGKLVTPLAVEASQFPKARLAADPDLPVKEWFSERVRLLNEQWLDGHVAEDSAPLLVRLWRQMLARLREIFAQVRRLDEADDLFTDTFRAWLRTGNEANIAPAATAYASRQSATFATQGSFDFADSAPEPTRQQLVVPRNRRINKPIKGPSGAQIVGYEWRSTVEDRFDRRDGGYVAKRVSDWSAPETSQGTGRQIVHVFYVKKPDGTISTEGINSAQNILGISAPRLRSIASTAQLEQETRARQEADTAKRYESIAKPTAREALIHYFERNTRGMSEGEAFQAEDRLLGMALALEKDGKFVVLPRPQSEESDVATLKAAGWNESPGKPWAQGPTFATDAGGPPDGGAPFLTREQFGEASDDTIRAEYQRVSKLLLGKKIGVSLRTDLYRLLNRLKEEGERRGLPALDASGKPRPADSAPAAKKPTLPPGVKTGADLEREQEAAKARESEAAKATRHPAAVGDVEPGMAWADTPKLTPEQLAEQVRKIDDFVNDNALDLADIERADLNARREATEAEIARRKATEKPPAEEVRLPIVPPDVVGTPVPGIVKPDPETALIAEWKRGRAMRDEGRRLGNIEAEDEGQALMGRAKARLDMIAPDWEDKVYGKRGDRSAARPDQIAEDDGRNLPPPPPDEPTDTLPPAGDPPAPDRGRARDIVGHSSVTPFWWEKSWAKVRAGIVGFRGSIPELPAFPALAAQTDRFIREHGPNFYDGLRAFYRKINSSNDAIQQEAAEKVGSIVSPLMARAGKFDASAWRKLKARLEQRRRLSAENRPMPPGAQIELDALRARLETHPLYLFNELVVWMDFDWRKRNLKDDSGNPIILPGNVNQTEIENHLAHLGRAIAASPHAAMIEDAFAKHMALVRQTADDLKSRDLLAAEHLANPYYFPHLTLEKTSADGERIEQRELTPERVRVGTDEDFRGYLITPKGSPKMIETDYVRAMYYHLVQVGAHNLKADAVRDHVLPYEKMAEVKKRAQELSKERGASVDWNQAFNEEYAPRGYVQMTIEQTNPYNVLAIDRDKLARRLGVMLTSEDLHKQLAELGVKGVKLLPEDITQSLIQGGKEIWIVPARVAQALRGIEKRSQREDMAVETALKMLNGWWKRWKLFMPQNHVRYEYGNVVADLEKLFSASPRTFRFVGQSAKEMRAFFAGEAPSDDLRAALKLGVINAITAQEIDQLQRLRAFEKFQTAGERVALQLRKRASSALYQPVTNFLGLGDLSSVELSALREGVTRYANFLANLDAIRHGARPDYAGAYWKDIDAIGDTRPGANDRAIRQAAQISKATFGDYGDLSVTGQYLRDKFIPFYSWMEVNFKYHANLFRNLRDMVRGELEGGKGKAAAQGARAIGALVGGRTSWLAGKVLLRLAVPYVAVALWNAMGPHDVDDDELSEEDRRRFHIRLGHDEDGKALVVYGNTALADVMKWFGGARFVDAFGDWLAGRTDFATALDAWASSLPGDLANNTIGSAGPILKIPVTALTKQNFFPDVLDSRTIPDYELAKNVIGQMTDEFTADLIVKAADRSELVRGALNTALPRRYEIHGDVYLSPKDVGEWAQQLILQVRRRDPESWAYYSIKDKAAQFEYEKTGKLDGYRSGNDPAAQLVRNFRKSIYRGDVESATRFYLRLLEMGYTAEQFAQSVRSQDPLEGLPKKNGLRRQFVESLDEFDREQLSRAYAFYTRMSVARGRERALFPSERMGERGAERFRERPRTEQLTQIIESRERFSDDDVLRRADMELRKSLARSR